MTDDEKRACMARAQTDPEYREECVRGHLERDRAMCVHLKQQGIDPYVQLVQFDPFKLIGRWVRLNDGKLVQVTGYDPYWGLVNCGPGLTYPLNAWVKATLTPQVMPKDWSP